MKTLLIGLMTLVISFQTFALSETRYYPTGEVKEVEEFVDGKLSKVTIYYKTGEIEEIQEYVNGKKSKTTNYYKTGEVWYVKKVLDKPSLALAKRFKTYVYTYSTDLSAIYSHRLCREECISTRIRAWPHDAIFWSRVSCNTRNYPTGEPKWVDRLYYGDLSSTIFYHRDGQVSEIIGYYLTGEPKWRVKKCVDAECSKVRCVDGECSKVTWYAKTTYYNKTGEALSTTHYIQEDLIQEDLKNLIPGKSLKTLVVVAGG